MFLSYCAVFLLHSFAELGVCRPVINAVGTLGEEGESFPEEGTLYWTLKNDFFFSSRVHGSSFLYFFSPSYLSDRL